MPLPNKCEVSQDSFVAVWKGRLCTYHQSSVCNTHIYAGQKGEGVIDERKFLLLGTKV